MTLALTFAFAPHAEGKPVKSPLQAACAADQKDRQAHDRDPTRNDWSLIERRDRQRQELVLADLRAGRVRSFEEHRCAALILLHAGEEDRLRLAFAVATQGELLFGDGPELRRLAARAWDRLMMARRQPQWYATQFDKSSTGHHFELYPLAQGVLTEQERVARGGLSDAAVAAQLQQLNATHRPSAAAEPAPATEKLRFSASPALLKEALAQDEWLGNALALFVRGNIKLTQQGEPSGRMFFLLRPIEGLTAAIDNPSLPLPAPLGSATPTAASAIVYRLTKDAQGHGRLVMGLDNLVQAADEMVVKPSRWFEVTVSVNDGELAALSWRPLPSP